MASSGYILLQGTATDGLAPQRYIEARVTDRAVDTNPRHLGGEEQADSLYSSQLRVQRDSKAFSATDVGNGQQIYTGASRLNGCIFTTTNDLSVVFYDGTSTAGSRIGFARQSYNMQWVFPGVRALTGIYAKSTASGISHEVLVYYKEAKYS